MSKEMKQVAESHLDGIVEQLQRFSYTLSVAESLTGGMLTSRFAKLQGSGSWFRGGIVAYASDVKYDVLGVRRGPVISRSAALEMAQGAAKTLGSDVAVSLTGVGGPQPQENQRPGTVWAGVHIPHFTSARLFDFEGSPDQICEAAAEAAVQLLADVLRQYSPESTAP